MILITHQNDALWFVNSIMGVPVLGCVWDNQENRQGIESGGGQLLTENEAQELLKTGTPQLSIGAEMLMPAMEVH